MTLIAWIAVALVAVNLWELVAEHWRERARGGDGWWMNVSNICLGVVLFAGARFPGWLPDGVDTALLGAAVITMFAGFHARHRAEDDRYPAALRETVVRVRRAQWQMMWVALGAWLAGSAALFAFPTGSVLGWVGVAAGALGGVAALARMWTIPKRVGLRPLEEYQLLPSEEFARVEALPARGERARAMVRGARVGE